MKERRWRWRTDCRPTKEHVLLELEQREEERIAKQFAQFLKKPHDLAAALAELRSMET